MNIRRLLNKHALLGRLGSFWGQGVIPASLNIARKLSHFIDHSAATGSINQAVQQMAGVSVLPFEHKTVHFKPTDLVTNEDPFSERLRTVLGTSEGTVVIMRRPELYETIIPGLEMLTVIEGLALLAENDSFLLFPSMDGYGVTINMLRTAYFLKVPFNLTYTSLETPTRTLMAGVDFIQQPGLLIFVENPATLFENFNLVVRAGYEKAPSPLCYTFQLDSVQGSMQRVSDYYRGQISASTFEKAIAAATGLTIVDKDTVVLQVIVGAGYKRSYVTAEGMLEVPYKHTPMDLGTFLTAGTIIGGAVKVFGSQEPNATWWRESNWTRGINMDDFCAVKGLKIPDSNVLCDAEYVSEDVHVRLHLLGSEAALQQYWALTRQNEIQSGFYMNSVLELADVNAIDYVNGIDFFFEHMLKVKSLVVELHTEELGAYYHHRAINFIKREKPSNILTIINSL